MSGQANAGTPLQISTLADTWIHLNYLVQAGERNRGMSIPKALHRGDFVERVARSVELRHDFPEAPGTRAN
jgi:hypothetical protein